MTPGHTHEHLSFLLLDDEKEVGVFTGGSLIVGSAARTDLLGPDRTEVLARAQYVSLQRLAALPGDVAVWPTHGAGSFCSAPPGAERTSTIARERATNPLLAARDEDTFVARLLGSLGSYPPYFRRLGEINRLGPPLLEQDPVLEALTVDTACARLADGAALIDVRPLARFAAAHIPGALSIPLRPVFASWLGWLAPVDRPLIIVRDDDQDVNEIMWQAMKIGYDNLIGELDGGLAAWTSAELEVAATALTGPDGVDNVRVLDIRQRPEYLAGHLPGAVHIELGALVDKVDDLPDEPTVVMCGHGERAMGAASLLERAGHRNLTVLEGGPDDWAAATGRTLETGA
ncbi:putative hydrolase protein (plasmid) [Rhodococcus ruber]|nr:putative hydrolase protein [Rhodococcus ruber]